MRDELAAAVPSVDVRDGTAESIPLPDAAVDLVTVAQAFHWFRFEEAWPRSIACCVPGGSLAILFNERDERVPWVEAWNEVIEWHSRRIAGYQNTDWTARARRRRVRCTSRITERSAYTADDPGPASPHGCGR